MTAKALRGMVSLKPRQVICLDNAFGGNDQLKTNTVLEMRDHDIEFRTVLTGDNNMNPIRIFISSVQKEFTKERKALRDYLCGDELMRRFFEVFLFEGVPAKDRRPDEVYLDEVERCDIYIGLFGIEYGAPDAEGVSPTERKFRLATDLGKYRLIFIKEAKAPDRHPGMKALIDDAQRRLIRRSFASSSELVAKLYASLVEYLEVKHLIRTEPFDMSPCAKVTIDDLDYERMTWFIRTARRARRFPLSDEASPVELLEHLNLLNDGRWGIGVGPH